MKKIKINGKKKQHIYKTLKQYRQVIEDKGFEVLFIGVKGSQNYNLDYDGSDIDCICAVKPPKYGTKPISFKINMDEESNENTVSVQDIFTFTAQVNKGNNSYIEVLNSPFKISKLPAKYAEAKCNAKSHYHMMIQKFKALSHPYPSKLAVIEKYGYDPKQLHHIFRLYYLIQDAEAGLDPRDVWVEDEIMHDYLMVLKTEPTLAFECLEDVEVAVKEVIADAETIINCSSNKEIFNTQVDNGITDEYIMEYLESLDLKDTEYQQAELVDKVYKILNNAQYLDKSLSTLKDELNQVYNIDIRRVETKVVNKKANEPTKDFDALDKVYRDFLALLDLDGANHAFNIECISSQRDIAYSEAKSLVEEYGLSYMNEELYTYIINSASFEEFSKKHHDVLKETPGFYQKFNISENKWVWKFVFAPGIIIPNQVDGKIRNLQVRGIKEGRSKYFNFSSSKKTGDFYRFATKAHQGISLLISEDRKNELLADKYFAEVMEDAPTIHLDKIELMKDSRTLVVTEGFFKAAKVLKSKGIFNKLLKQQDIEETEDYDVLSLPGLSAGLSDINFSQYNRVIFAFDRDCHLGDNKQAKKQYKNMVNKVKKACGSKVTFDEYIPTLKVDDDIVNAAEFSYSLHFSNEDTATIVNIKAVSCSLCTDTFISDVKVVLYSVETDGYNCKYEEVKQTEFLITYPEQDGKEIFLTLDKDEHNKIFNNYWEDDGKLIKLRPRLSIETKGDFVHVQFEETTLKFKKERFLKLQETFESVTKPIS